SEHRRQQVDVLGGDDGLQRRYGRAGDGATPLSVGAAAILDNGGSLDSVNVSSGVVLGGLLTSRVNDVTLQQGSEVTFGVLDRAVVNCNNSLKLQGKVDGNVAFIGNTLADTITLAADASIGGSLRAHTADGDDVVDLEGKIGNSVLLDTGAGNDSVRL